MFDCLEITPALRAQRGDAILNKDSLTRRFVGQNWARLKSRGPESMIELAKVRELALYLDAELYRVDDGSLALVGLSLNELLALNERFGQKLAIEAVIALNATAH
ncbi:hypothetical protein KSF73_09475 [Burkholderiaceae bacterium DAT-1]|nr:hypothetical protein [Burkholderiaceae bacterium DAT-1]